MTISALPDNVIRFRLDRAAQAALARVLAGILASAPPFRPVMPRWGTPFSVLMSNCGPLGWVSDKSGYRYQPTHPVTSRPWPPMPDALLDIWTAATGYPLPPEACLVNLYAPDARMGLHQDRDEKDFDAPVVSISLGDTALFRLGGNRRNGGTTSFELASGDVMTLAGPNRLAFHGVDRIRPGTSDLPQSHPDAFRENARRINLTLRRVSPAS